MVIVGMFDHAENCQVNGIRKIIYLGTTKSWHMVKRSGYHARIPFRHYNNDLCGMPHRAASCAAYYVKRRIPYPIAEKMRYHIANR